MENNNDYAALKTPELPPLNSFNIPILFSVDFGNNFPRRGCYLQLQASKQLS